MGSGKKKSLWSRKNPFPTVLFFCCFVGASFLVWVFFRGDAVSYSECSIHDPSRCSLGFVIDAGSSGCRLQSFLWPKSSGTSGLQRAVLKDGAPLIVKNDIGLATFAYDPSRAFDEAIRPLLDTLLREIPHLRGVRGAAAPSLHIYATAGLRLLAPTPREKILANIVLGVESHFSCFHFSSSNVKVLPGKLEAVYNWIAVNYMLNRFHDPVGAIDMGGASTEIAHAVSDSVMLPAENIVEVFNHRVYVATYLGFGANVAKERHLKSLISRVDGLISSDISVPSMTVEDPCMPSGWSEEVQSADTKVLITGSGDFRRCKSSIVPMLNRSTACSFPPCSFAGVPMPDIDLGQIEFFGFSEYWYSTRDALFLTGPYDSQKFRKAAAEYCNTSWSELQRKFLEGEYPSASTQRLEDQCFKSSWLDVVTHHGLQLPLDVRLTIASQINGMEVDWTMGAMLHINREGEIVSKLQLGIVLFLLFALATFVVFVFMRRRALGGWSKPLCGRCESSWTRIRSLTESHIITPV